MLLEEPARLPPRAVRLLNRLLDPVTAFVDRALNRPEGEPLEHEERDPERDQRPDHQAGNDLDQAR
jgi:hypothetical protein